MEQNQILEGNKLIAEFMDHDVAIEVSIGFGGRKGIDTVHHSKVGDWNKTRMYYHNSWRDLMPVLSTIHAHPDCPSGIIIDDYHHRAYHEKGDKIFEAETTLEATYNCVVWSIKWLNEHGK